MSERGKERYDRSRYRSRSESRPGSRSEFQSESRGRYYDTFFEEMQITDEPEAPSFSSRLSGDKQRRSMRGRDDALADVASPPSEQGVRAEGRKRSAAISALAAKVPAVIRTAAPTTSREAFASPAATVDSPGSSGSPDLPDSTAPSSARKAASASARAAAPHPSTAAVNAAGIEHDPARAARAADQAHAADPAQAADPGHAPDPARAADPGASGDAGAPEPRGKAVRWALRVAVAAAVAAVLVGAGMALAYYNGVGTNFRAGIDQELLDVLVETDMANEPFYMLLLGTDGSAERDTYEDLGGSYRSDSMILARVDVPSQKITLVTIPRDIPIDLGEYGEQKINAAYTFGGPALAVKEVSKLAGVPISHYAQVDFDGFSSMVDAVGGVNVVVPMYIDDPDAGGTLQAGEQTLNGQQALILCRARHAYDEYGDGDMMRTANQRAVIASIVESALASDIGTIARTVKAASDYVTTDLEMNDIIGLAQAMRGIDTVNNIYTASAPTTSKYEDGGWYEYLDETEWKAMMERVNAGEPPVKESLVDRLTGVVLATAGDGSVDTSEKHCTVTVKNATGTEGLDERVQATLRDAGYVNAEVGSANGKYSYPNTIVVYDDEGRESEAQAILDVVGQGRLHYDSAGEYTMDYTDFLVILGKDWE